MPSGEKTEAATPRRREEARKRGSIPKSTELNSVLVLIASVLVLRYAGGTLLTQLLELVGNSLRNLTGQDWTISGLSTYGNQLGTLYFGMMAPLFATLVIVGVASNLVQAGPVLSTKPFSPDFSRLDPFKGFQRIFSPRSLVELVKSMAKLSIVGYVVYQALQDKYTQIAALSGTDVRGAAGMIADVATQILLQAGFALLAVAVVDYGYQRWQYERDIRMTKEELKEELRQSEGDPKMRARIRQQQRQMASKRMMHDVPAADVVVTNPTHLAVAIQYRPESMRAPKVIAKGQRLVAERIKEIARQHSVPVVENKPLAQALYKAVEVGFEVPAALYHAVAEVLAFIYSLKRERRFGGRSLGS